MGSSTIQNSPSLRTEPNSEPPGIESPRRKKATPHASMLYRNLMPAYEMVWPLVARHNIWNSIHSLNIQPGQRILEVGVGTGLSLPAYPNHADITGVDLSEEMLGQANVRIREKAWSHIRVMCMNAEQLGFDDDSFDMVTSFHVVSVVSDPYQMMSEVVRVCKPGGRILIINHFRSQNPWIAKMIDSAGPVTRHLGWRTDLRFDDCVRDLPLRIEARYKPTTRSLFTVFSATKVG